MPWNVAVAIGLRFIGWRCLAIAEWLSPIADESDYKVGGTD